MNFRTPLANAQGLGSAKSGTFHWWMQRVSAAALIPLTFVPIRLMELSLSAPYEQTLAWLKSPINSVFLAAWIIAVFYHAALGLRVVIEDYLEGEGKKIATIWLVNLVFLFLALAALIAMFRALLAG